MHTLPGAQDEDGETAPDDIPRASPRVRRDPADFPTAALSDVARGVLGRRGCCEAEERQSRSEAPHCRGRNVGVIVALEPVDCMQRTSKGWSLTFYLRAPAAAERPPTPAWGSAWSRQQEGCSQPSRCEWISLVHCIPVEKALNLSRTYHSFYLLRLEI